TPASRRLQSGLASRISRIGDECSILQSGLRQRNAAAAQDGAFRRAGVAGIRRRGTARQGRVGRLPCPGLGLWSATRPFGDGKTAWLLGFTRVSTDSVDNSVGNMPNCRILTGFAVL